MKALYIFICLMTAVSVQAYEPKEEFDFRENGLCFNIISEEDKTVEITTGNTDLMPPPNCDYDMSDYGSPNWWVGGTYEGSIDVPLTVSHEGVEYNVIAIGPGAFVRCYRLSSVTIPEGITSVGEAAFCLCTNLKELRLPDSVIELGIDAFAACTELKDFFFPSGIRVIPEKCFLNVGTWEYPKHPTVYTNLWQYENIEQIGDKAFNMAVMKSFDFSITKITGSDKLGANIFTDSYIQEITLPTTWADADYAVLLSKICDGGVPQKLTRLILDRDVPPMVDATQITDIPETLYTQVTLEVPQESVDDYRESEFWSRFTNIKVLGIDSVPESVEGDATYYTIEGLPLKGEPEHGIFIRRQGNKVEKVIL